MFPQRGPRRFPSRLQANSVRSAAAIGAPVPSRSPGRLAAGGQDSDGPPALLPGKYREISAGGSNTCAIREDRSIDCWGSTASAHVAGAYRNVQVVGESVCAIRSNRNLVCRDDEDSEDDDWLPSRADGPFTALSANDQLCALKADRSAICWTGDPSPTRHAGPFTALSVGWGHVCALRADQDIACWGDNEDHQAPSRVAGPFVAVSAGTWRPVRSGSPETWPAGAPASRRPASSDRSPR